MTRIYGLTSFATALYDALYQPSILDSTKQDLLTAIRGLEGQIVADRWSEMISKFIALADVTCVAEFSK